MSKLRLLIVGLALLTYATIPLAQIIPYHDPDTRLHTDEVEFNDAKGHPYMTVYRLEYLNQHVSWSPSNTVIVTSSIPLVRVVGDHYEIRFP